MENEQLFSDLDEEAAEEKRRLIQEQRELKEKQRIEAEDLRR